MARTRQRSWSTLLLVGALASVAAAVLFAYTVGLASPAVGFFHDDGIYLVTAEALAEERGYRIISLPVEIAQTKYPIFFPLLLSFAWRLNPVFPDNLLLVRLVPFLAGFVWLFLVYQFVRREGEDRLTAAVITALGAASPLVVFSFTAVLSETLFAAFAWATLNALRPLERGRRGQARSAVVPAVLCAAAIHTRLVGLALLPAGAWALWRRGRGRAATVFVGVAVLAVLPWLAWTVIHQPPSIPGSDYYTAVNYRGWNIVLNFGWAEKVRILGWNLFYLGVAPGQLLPARGLPWPLLLGISLFVVWRLVEESIQRPMVGHAFTWAYLSLLLLWTWLPGRLVIPVYPLLLLYFWRGLRRAVEGSRTPSSPGPVLRVLGTVLLLNAGWAAFAWARATARTVVACPLVACDTDWSEFRRAVDWIRRRTPEDAVLLGNLDPALYLYTGRKAVRPFSADPFTLFYSFEEDRDPLGEPEVILRRAAKSGGSYLVWTPVGSFAEEPYFERMLRELERKHPGRLVRVEEASATRVTVYRIEGRPFQDRAPGKDDP